MIQLTPNHIAKAVRIGTGADLSLNLAERITDCLNAEIRRQHNASTDRAFWVGVAVAALLITAAGLMSLYVGETGRAAVATTVGVAVFAIAWRQA